MAASPLYIVLCSGEREKVQMAAMLASVAAVSERPVRVFVSMNAISVFRAGISDEQRYHGGEFAGLLREKKAPDPITLFQQGKMLGGLRMHACSMALDLTGLKVADLVEELFDDELGLTAFLSDAEDGELVVL